MLVMPASPYRLLAPLHLIEQRQRSNNLDIGTLAVGLVLLEGRPARDASRWQSVPTAECGHFPFRRGRVVHIDR